jgi:flagellar protein FliL
MADLDSDDGGGGAAGKPGFLKNILGNKKLLVINIIVVVLLLVGVVAGVYFFVLGGNEAKPEQNSSLAAGAPQAVYLDLPDFLVNIQGVDGATAYLKLSVSLELSSEEEKNGFAVVQPRVIDQLQGYLRELRTDDLKGSAGIMRLKEEMLRRIEIAAAPYHVRDVLLKEMVVQ